MNLIRMLGLDTNEVYGGVLIFFGVFAFVFAYFYWKKTAAWKKDAGEKTRFTEIWKPSTLFGCALFLLLGLGFLFLGDILEWMKPEVLPEPTVFLSEQAEPADTKQYYITVPYYQYGGEGPEGLRTERGTANVFFAYPTALFSDNDAFARAMRVSVFYNDDLTVSYDQLFNAYLNETETFGYLDEREELSTDGCVSAIKLWRYLPKTTDTASGYRQLYLVKFSEADYAVVSFALDTPADTENAKNLLDAAVRNMTVDIS